MSSETRRMWKKYKIHAKQKEAEHFFEEIFGWGPKIDCLAPKTDTGASKSEGSGDPDSQDPLDLLPCIPWQGKSESPLPLHLTFPVPGRSGLAWYGWRAISVLPQWVGFLKKVTQNKMYFRDLIFSASGWQWVTRVLRRKRSMITSWSGIPNNQVTFLSYFSFTRRM